MQIPNRTKTAQTAISVEATATEAEREAIAEVEAAKEAEEATEAETEAGR